MEAILQPESCCRPYQCRFSGATDSEQTFCYLLQKIACVMPEPTDPVDDDWFAAVAAASRVIAANGQFDFLLSDGVRLLAHAHDRPHEIRFKEKQTWSILLASEPWGAATSGSRSRQTPCADTGAERCGNTLRLVRSIQKADSTTQVAVILMALNAAAWLNLRSEHWNVTGCLSFEGSTQEQIVFRSGTIAIHCLLPAGGREKLCT